jgi:hypothetical protein
MSGVKLLVSILFLVLGLLAASTSQGALYDRVGGLIYDSDLNITWLQNAAYGAGSV